jgi:hypothetical protein
MTIIVFGPVALALALVIHFGLGRRQSRQVRPWIEAAGYTLLAAVLLYAWGVEHIFSWDLKETCGLRYGEPVDPAYAYTGDHFWPLSQRCNATFDLVPAYVNPGVAVLTAASPVCLAVALFVGRRVRIGGTR